MSKDKAEVWDLRRMWRQTTPSQCHDAYTFLGWKEAVGESRAQNNSRGWLDL